MKDLESTKVNESTSPDCGKPVVMRWLKWEWPLKCCPNDGQEVEILRYGKIEKAKYDQRKAGFHPWTSFGNCYCLGSLMQEGVEMWRSSEAIA